MTQGLLPGDRSTGAVTSQVQDEGPLRGGRGDPIAHAHRRRAARIRCLYETCRINYRMRGWVNGVIVVGSDLRRRSPRPAR